MARPTVAEIDTGALVHNWKILTSMKEAQQLIPVVKANAYGHGIENIVFPLLEEGAQSFAVALFEEALELRKTGYQGRLVVLGPFDRQDISEAQRLKITPMVGDKQFLMHLIEKGFVGSIHLKWDTGMHRLGLSSEDIPWAQKVLAQAPQLHLEGLCTHFLKADDYGQKAGFTAQQVQDFLAIETHFPEVKEKHLFNSDGLFGEEQYHLLPDSYGARPGICLYGYTGIKTPLTAQLRPVMTLKTKIVHQLRVKKGQSVSYNATWTAERDSQIAVLPLGYADGYPRSLSNKGQVLVRGMTVPLVGTVCMDYLMIDVTDVPGVSMGDDVELWGNHISLEFLAQQAATITYEMLSALTKRVPRHLKK